MNRLQQLWEDKFNGYLSSKGGWWLIVHDLKEEINKIGEELRSKNIDFDSFTYIEPQSALQAYKFLSEKLIELDDKLNQFEEIFDGTIKNKYNLWKLKCIE